MLCRIPQLVERLRVLEHIEASSTPAFSRQCFDWVACGELEQQVAVTARRIASEGLPSMLSDDQLPFVFGYCAAAALHWIFALEETIIVPFMFGFVYECLELAAAFAT